MTRGMYTAATGMLANQAAQDAIAQNLANANTTGYKQDIPRFQSFNETLMQRMSGSGSAAVGGLGHGVSLHDVVTDFSDGSQQMTGNPLDIALTGDAALVIQTSNGIRESRDGALTLDPSGALVQANGSGAILGDNGQPIRVPAKAKNITISPQGEIDADGKRVGRLRLVGLSRTSGAVKMGDNQFIESALRPASPAASVKQGYLEMSNVSVVKEMVAMIAIQRAYETDQKMVQAEDDATGKAVTEVAKV